MKIKVSEGNVKMGAIKSFSLPAVKTCNPSAPCFKKCYAVRMERLRKTVRDAYAVNYDIAKNDHETLKNELNDVLKMNAYFRFHVSGDFFSDEYFADVVEVVKKNKHCKVLAFTKQYDIVNEWIRKNGNLPKNFKVIFSRWGDFKGNNPYNLPESTVIFKGQEPDKKIKICGGNCFECACRGCGCWELRKGQIIGFYEH